MDAFEDLVHELLGDVNSDLAKNLLHELENEAKDLAVNHVRDVVGRLLVKGVDGVVAAAVKVLDHDHAHDLGTAYLDKIDEQFMQLVSALQQYVPLQAAVELSKREHGDHSPEAESARKARETGIAAVKNQVGDIFSVVVGHPVKD